MGLQRGLSCRLDPQWGRRTSRTLTTALAALLLSAGAAAQAPLFTFLQTSDSQAADETDWNRFEDVLEMIANAGKPGALIPRPLDLVLFPGDITEGNDSTDWVRCRNLFDTYITANNIPLLCTPGNRDQGSSANQTQLYQQYIGSAGVWETGSASWTGQNGKSRNTGWAGLRFIGFNSSNGAWNKISDADLALIASRVTAADNADENIFLVTHHPHNGQSRIPLAAVLPNPSIVGYVRGHSGDPKASKGLSGVNNPNAWDLNTNAIVDDRDAIYYEVFQTQIKAYVIVLDTNSSSLPSAQTIQLVHSLRSPTGAQDIGFEGGSHSGARAWPSGFAPDKKLWSQGGNWFGVLWSESSSSYRIFRLDTSSQTWVDTGTTVSSTSARSFDALSDGSTKLFLASHYQAAPSAAGSGQPGQVLRYTYNSGSRNYTLDSGFPVNVNDLRTESLSIARDSLGTLWATWQAGGQVFTAHTLGDDLTWSAGVALPLSEADGLDGEDVSALVAFAGKLACVWTDRTTGAVYAATREDALAPGTWLLETALSAPGAVADVLDVTTSAGKLFVASASSSGIVRLLKRELGAAGSGPWTQYTVADAATGLSQPIVLVDEAQARVRVYATGASASGGSSSGGGVVYEKSAPLSTLSFGPGKGTIVLQDGQNFAMGRATSTRQALSNATGLAVVASNELSQRSWHLHASLGTPPAAPDADFSGSPRSGTAPLLVHFTDLSSGAPTDWLWTFGDGATSTEASPDHVYASPGTYTVSLRASNSVGSDTLSRSSYVTVGSSTPTVTLTSIADSTTSEQNKSSNLGTNNTIRVKDQGSKDFRSFVKFDLAGVSGTITSAKLRLYCVDSSDNGGTVYSVTSSWSESTLTWSNQPALGSSLANAGAVSSNAWKEIDVSSAVGGGGQVSFALAGGTSNVCAYTSREGTNKPQLLLTVQGTPQAPVADFSGSPLSGTAPLAVQFSDLSSGTPTSWSWSFGDSTSATQKNPLHTYSTPGTYTVSLTATNGIGSNTRTRTNYVTVLSPGGGPGQTFLPVADARVYESSSGSNYGADAVLRMKTQAGSSYRSFMKFDLSSLAGAPTSARLRIFVTDESNSGGSVYLVPNTWTEGAITWGSQPALPPSPVASAGTAPAGAWLEFDVSSAVLGPGVVSFGHAGGTTNSIYYSSREGANPPQLVVETAGP